jgi:hypothetical protein
MDNGKDYWKGVYIYSSLPDNNPQIVSRLKDCRNDSNVRVLDKLLLDAFLKLKEVEVYNHAAAASTDTDNSAAADVYAECKKEADTAYKQLMNSRAILFSLANKEKTTPEEMEQRRELALQVVTGYKTVSELYDKADYVKQHGTLPDTKPVEEKKVPDVMVYCVLDNLRKNVSKLKKRPPTPERLQLIAQQSLQIEELEKRWHLLKQTT